MLRLPKELFNNNTEWTKANYISSDFKQLGIKKYPIGQVQYCRLSNFTDYTCYLWFGVALEAKFKTNDDAKTFIAELNTNYPCANFYGAYTKLNAKYQIENNKVFMYWNPLKQTNIFACGMFFISGMERLKNLVSQRWQFIDLTKLYGISYRDLMLKQFNALPTLTTTTKTLTLGSALLAKLTDEDKKIATDKGWTLA